MINNIINHFRRRKISKTFRNNYLPTNKSPISADIKSVITEHSKTSLKLSNTIRQAEKVGSHSSLYSDIKKH